MFCLISHWALEIFVSQISQALRNSFYLSESFISYMETEGANSHSPLMIKIVNKRHLSYGKNKYEPRTALLPLSSL